MRGGARVYAEKGPEKSETGVTTGQLVDAGAGVGPACVARHPPGPSYDMSTTHKKYTFSQLTCKGIALYLVSALLGKK